MTTPELVSVQARGRITLGKLAKHDRYLVRRESDGTIIMEPAEVLPITEAKLLADRDLMAVIAANAADPSRLRTRDRSRSPRSV